MALQVWLPLMGDFHNQGIGDITIISGTPIFTDDGKVGKSSLDLNSRIKFDCTALSGKKEFSFSVWLKSGSQEEYTYSWIDLISFMDSKGSLFRLENSYGNATAVMYACSVHNNPSYAIMPSQNGIVNSDRDVWYHVCATVSEEEGIKIYCNNILKRKSPHGGGYITGRIGLGECYNSNNKQNAWMQDLRIYDHCLSSVEIKELSQGLVVHYLLNNNLITNFSEAGNLIPNSKTMDLGSANVSLGRWRIAGSNSMTRSRVKIIDSPYGECFGFQNSGTQTLNDGSCYGIDSTTYFEPNTEYRISMLARITSGTEGYAGFNIYAISAELGGSHTKIDKNYRVTPLNSDGTWTYCWYHIKTNSAVIRNIYIGITTGDTDVTTQMCLVRIDKWNDEMDSNIEYDISGYGNNGVKSGDFTDTYDAPKYLTSSTFSGSERITTDDIEIETTDSTIMAWIKSPLTLSNFILDGRNSDGIGKQPIYEYTTGAIQTGGSVKYVTTKTGLLEADTWIHVAIVQDSDTILVYKNGTLFQTLNCMNSPIISPTIGSHYSNSSRYNGQLSDVRIYTTALSASDILSIYQNNAYIDSEGTIHGAIY